MKKQTVNNMKIFEAIKAFFVLIWEVVYTIISIPGYLIWVVVSRRRMNKRYIKNTKRNRKKYGIRMDEMDSEADKKDPTVGR